MNDILQFILVNFELKLSDERIIKKGDLCQLTENTVSCNQNIGVPLREEKIMKAGRRQTNNQIDQNDLIFSSSMNQISRKQFQIIKNVNGFQIICLSPSNPTCIRVFQEPQQIHKDLIIELPDENIFYIRKIIKLQQEDQIVDNQIFKADGSAEEHLEIKVLNGILKNKIFQFNSIQNAMISIGKDKKCDIQFLSKNVENFHCQIFYFNNLWFVGEKQIPEQISYTKGGTLIYLKTSKELGSNKPSQPKLLKKGMNIQIQNFIMEIL